MQRQQDKNINQYKQINNQKETISLGIIKFKPSFNNIIKSELISQPIGFILSREKWHLYYQYFYNFSKHDQLSDYIRKLSSLLQYIQSSKCISIQVKLYYIQPLFNNLPFPLFYQLKQLICTQNNIQNIQSIAFFNMPNIQKLWITSNLVTISKPIYKTLFKNMNVLGLPQHRLTSIGQLQRLYIGKQVRNISLLNMKKQKLCDQSQRRRVPYLNQWAKLQISKQNKFNNVYLNKQLRYNPPNGINQNKVRQKTKQKFIFFITQQQI